MNPRSRAIVFTASFAVIGLLSLLLLAPLSSMLWPHIVFYTVLLINTFFSIRFYSTIQPDDGENRIIDALLVVAYLLFALSIGRSIAFGLTALMLYVAATAKYALMLGKVPHLKLLRKKILLDLLGLFSAVLLIIATLFGAGHQAAWALAIGFGLANIYLLAVKPMYRLED